MSRCKIVGAFLTSPMLHHRTDNAAAPKTSAGLSDRPVAAPRQLVGGVGTDEGLARVGAFAVQLGESALHVPPHHADGDPEDALASLQQGVNLVRGGALVDGGAVAHQRHALQVAKTALPEVLDGRTDVLERDPG